MKHSSRKAWATIDKLTGRKNISPNPPSMIPASCLMQNVKFKEPNREFTINVKNQLKMKWNSPSTDQDLYNDFSTIKTLKADKAPSPNNLHPEFFLHLDEKSFEWLRILFSNCLSAKKLPKVWKMEKVIATLKPSKPADNPGSYRLISLLCILCKFKGVWSTIESNPLLSQCFLKNK